MKTVEEILNHLQENIGIREAIAESLKRIIDNIGIGHGYEFEVVREETIRDALQALQIWIKS